MSDGTAGETIETACQFGQACDKPTAYLITYDEDYVGGSYAACVDCAAEARACDPLQYIESVVSLPRRGSL